MSLSRSVVAAVWATGILQGLCWDVLFIAGLFLVGVGIWHWSIPATYVYAGLVLSGGSVLVSRVTMKPRAPKEP